MQTNRVKAALRNGQAVTGPIVNEARSVSFVKIMSQAGHDFMFFDMEHAMFNWETMLNLVQASLLADICPLVRVTDLSYPLVARALDSGAQGIIIPRVETREQVEAAVSFAKYPPIGRRGAGGDARYGYVRRDVRTAVTEANAESMVVVQVESFAGVENIDSIASVPGLDVVCLGPQDLSISMDVHGDFGHPRFVETLRSIVDVCARHGVATGMVEREAAAMERWYDMGMRFLCCNNDGNMIYQSASRDVAALRAFAT
jgi:2-keto-3-deoxy-L-rhamnonate aldolase RhmA